MKLLTKRLLAILLIVVIISQSGIYSNAATKFKATKSKLISTAYAKENIIIYSKPSTSSRMISTYIKNDKIKIVSMTKNKKWYKVKYNGTTRYIKKSKYISIKKDKKHRNNNRLSMQAGSCYGPSGRETYYNLPMGGVISVMRGMGFSEKKYPYWIRDDGAKMLGRYVMVAANLGVRPRGTTVETSLGTGLVCDTGGFAAYDSTQVDIATAW